MVMKSKVNYEDVYEVETLNSMTPIWKKLGKN